MQKILISACLLGDPVRYDGHSKMCHSHHLQRWQQQGRLVSICPEVAGGLGIPRPAAEVISRAPLQVITLSGTDVTHQFQQGAEQALALCQANAIGYAILKERSPSCGSQQNYDGSFSGRVVANAGVTAELLMANGIKVFSEETIQDLAQLIEVQGDG